MKRALAFFLCAALVAAASPPAMAAGSSDEAKAYYDAGVQAYTAGRYAVAVEAFTEAFKLTPKPSVLFSLAQAERRQFTAAGDGQVLKDAISHFRQYLKDVPEGGRRVDAVEALQELDVLLAHLDTQSQAAGAEKAASTRLMISVPAKDAAIRLDGKEYSELPAIQKVTPGKHTLHASAPGYIDEDREVVAVEGALVPIEITLKEKRSFLSLAAPRGALLTLDGQPLGEAPLSADLEIAPGSHIVAATQRGHEAFLRPVTVERGQVTTLQVSMPRTVQRWVSYGAAGAGGLALLTGAVLAIGAGQQEGVSKGIFEAAQHANIPPAKLDEYNASLAQRDDLRRGAGVTFGIAGTLALTAAALYLFDTPTPTVSDDPQKPRRPRISWALGPGGGSLGLTGSF